MLLQAEKYFLLIISVSTVNFLSAKKFTPRYLKLFSQDIVPPWSRRGFIFRLDAGPMVMHFDFDKLNAGCFELNNSEHLFLKVFVNQKQLEAIMKYHQHI